MSVIESDKRGFADRALEEAENILRFEEGDPHVPPADDLTRRRAIDAALEETQRCDLPSPPSEADQNSPRVHSRRWILVAVAAAAAVIWGTTIAFVEPTEEAKKTDLEKTASSAGDISAKVLLVAGESPSLANTLTVGQSLEEGRRIAVEKGNIVLGLSRKTRVHVSESSEIVLERLRSDVTKISLIKGNLLAAVEPGQEKPKYVVSTDHGRVVVTGTIFSVHKEAVDTIVKVFRGSVRVEKNEAPPLTITASQQSAITSEQISDIETEEEDLALAIVRSMEFLSEQKEVTLKIRSVPSGATVRLDDIALGGTPLIAAARTGNRDLELVLDGHTPVREQLQLGPGDTVSRVFDMNPIGESAANRMSPKTAVEIDRQASTRKIGETVSAKELLKRARSLRAKRDWSGAAAVYKELRRVFPRSAEARTAPISLGVIQLDHLGLPNQALKSFDAYLRESSGGALTAEALHGRARALKNLGRNRGEKTTLQRLLEEHPSSLRAPETRRRLAEMGIQ